MGTRANPGTRAKRRGLATFVSFLLLFAFAVGQSSLVALADDAGTDPVAEEEATDGSAGSLPDATAPAEEPPAEEPPAEDSGTDSGASSGGGATSASSDDGAGSSKDNTRNDRNVAHAGDAVIQSHGGLHGGDVSLDYVAAGPFTYSHATGLGVYPTFGFNDRTIDKDDGVVESLESGDFACGDHVTFFTQISIDEGADGPGTVQLHQTWGMEPTGQAGLGFNNIVSVALNTPDDGNVGNVMDNVVTLDQEFTETVGYDQLHGLISVTNLAPGETAILRIIVILACGAGEPTGNILNDIESARVVIGPDEFDTISVGQQTVPMKVTGFVAEPAIDIEKTCPATAPFGEDITFTFTLRNDGNEPLTDVEILDPLLGGDITDQFNLPGGLPDPLPVGDTVYTASISYSPGADEDPVENAVTVSASGTTSSTLVVDAAACDTDITHEPDIEVTKTCPESVPFGEDVEYTIVVTNEGNEPLVGVTVIDTLLGDITADFDFDFTTPFPVGGTATANVSYSPLPGDPDPLVNEVTATGTGEDSETEDTAEGSCVTDVLNPAIDIVKTVDDDSVPVGTTVTYTYVVTNTGDTTLFDVTVDDDILGHIGDIPVLEPGQSVTLTADFVVGDEPVINVAVAEGEDVLGRSVSADDDALVTPVLAETPVTPPSPTPFTGSDAARLGIIAMGLFGLGVTLVATTRRRRARPSA
ncbi:MAG TPA: hypothetical protein VFZ75_08770 [Actinomycetota bacterium]|nr:hypothetical protein [Actinomycetota bacterium]